MSLITARGQEVEKSINSKKVDLAKTYIRLKEGESIKVRLLGTNDYVEYASHGSFNHKIYTQPCIAPTGMDCPLCKASKSGIEEYEILYPKKRYLFAFADITTGDIRVWDCSKSQAKTLLTAIKEYEEDIYDVAFTFKRTGTKMETSYTLMPIMKLRGDDAENFHKFDDMKVEDEFFESVLIAKTPEYMMDILAESGFPMEQHFPEFEPKVVESEEDHRSII